MPFHNMNQIREANKRSGGHWFEPATLQFFGSRILAGLYGGRYFVTSEQPPHGPRRYSVRIAGDGGSIDTVGPFCGFASRRAAIRQAERLGRGEYPADPPAYL